MSPSAPHIFPIKLILKKPPENQNTAQLPPEGFSPSFPSQNEPINAVWTDLDPRDQRQQQLSPKSVSSEGFLQLVGGDWEALVGSRLCKRGIQSEPVTQRAQRKPLWERPAARL